MWHLINWKEKKKGFTWLSLPARKVTRKKSLIMNLLKRISCLMKRHIVKFPWKIGVKMWSKVNDLMVTTLPLHRGIKQYSDSYHAFEGLTHMSHEKAAFEWGGGTGKWLCGVKREIYQWASKKRKDFTASCNISKQWDWRGQANREKVEKEFMLSTHGKALGGAWVEKGWAVRGSNGERGKRSTLESEMRFKFYLRLETK